MHEDAVKLVTLLDLAPHPEGGFFRETWRAPLVLDASALPYGGPRAASTAIYFLLPAGAFSAFHRVASDEVWHHYAGEALDLHLIDDSGAHVHVVLGRDFAAGERPQYVVPAGVWQAATPRGASYALCGCTVAPGFDVRDFAMPARDELVALFPMHAALVTKLTHADRGSATA